MSTSSINSLLSGLGVSTSDTINQLLGQSSSTSTTNASTNSAIQSAVNAILNSATSTAGSGIDVQSTVDAILQIDAQPEIQLQNQVTTLNSQISTVQGLQTNLTAFQTAVQSLTDFGGDFGALTVGSTNNNVVSATAANGTAKGTHSVVVSHLAATAADYSASFASASAALPTGQFALKVGTGAAVMIPVNSANGTNTLSGLVSYINKQNVGVTASVITDTSGARLGLESQTSGAAGEITLTNDSTSADFSNYFESATSALPIGAFDLQVGSRAAVTIPVDSTDSTHTLSGLANYINQQGLGVAASVVTDANGSRLALIAQTSGADGAISVSNDTTGGGDGLNFTTAVGNSLGLTEAVAGRDAAFSVDGIPVTSASNTVTGVIPGMTLTLSSESSTPVTLQVSPDLTPIASDVNTLVSSWNTLIQAINTNVQYNSTTGATGSLVGDSAVATAQQQLLAAVASSMTGNNGIVNLQSIGIEMQNDGTLSVDSTKLNAALQNNFADVQNLFQSTASSSVGQKLNAALTSLTNPVSSPLALDINSIQSEVKDLSTQIGNFQLQLQNTQTQLLAEYNAINATLEQLPQTLAAINSQLDALNPQSSKS